MTEIEERYELACGRLGEVPAERIVPEPFRDFFGRTAAFLLTALKGREADNRKLYEDILPENYARSYGSPAYAADALGPVYGPMLSALYTELRGIIPCVFEEDTEGVTVLIELFLQIYGAFAAAAEGGDNGPADPAGRPKASAVREIFGSYLTDYLADHTEESLDILLGLKKGVASRIVAEADLTDLSYLEAYGEYVDDDIRKTAAFIGGLPEEKVVSIARTFTEGFRTGFINARKPLHKKKTVEIRYELGFERIVRAAEEQFREMGLTAVYRRASFRLTGKRQALRIGYYGAVPNKQFDYDHRNDIALILDKDFVSRKLRVVQTAYEDRKEAAEAFAGPAVLETFGQTPFEPESVPEALALTETQQKLMVDMTGQTSQITNRYIKGEERSFTIMALPVPAIGDQFEAIFEETVALNTLSSSEYKVIQQHLIDALDKGTHVRVLGCGANRTDLTIRLHKLTDPAKQSNFENCVADINIPVGEVFTSPVLAGTEGVLHVTGVYLEGLYYKDLEIALKDGMITSYGCGNFEDPAEGRQMMRENILFQHDTLPIGEFAIGTNTTAYVCGRKYGIEAYLPILIAEKTGPHFAFGDTCYCYEEDVPVYNPDGKELVARENECSALRKTDPAKAYFNCHTDITIPYDELGSITVYGDSGPVVLIENGRFVLPGTEALNVPLEEMT